MPETVPTDYARVKLTITVDTEELPDPLTEEINNCDQITSFKNWEQLVTALLELSAQEGHKLNLTGDGLLNTWKQGEPCPNCGSKKISGMSPTEDYYYSANGEMEVGEPGNWVGDTSDYFCPSCELELSKSH